MTRMEAMDHSEARQQMLTEKYLLNELPPDVRDAFEEHVFDCPECAMDLRAAVAFVDEAKAQLPELTAQLPHGAEVDPKPQTGSGNGAARKRGLFDWLRPLFASPAFAAPVFATLLAIVGYQNLVTYPALREASTEPRLLSSVALHVGARGGEPTVVEASRKQGVLLQIEVPEQAAYATYAVDLYDPKGKLAWTRKFSASATPAQDGTLSVEIPGAGLQQGSYSLAISGVSAAGQSTEIARRGFDVHLND